MKTRWENQASSDVEIEFENREMSITTGIFSHFRFVRVLMQETESSTFQSNSLSQI